MTQSKGRIGKTSMITDNSGQKFCIKELYDPILEPPFPSYFTDEISLLNSLKHPCLLKPHISEFNSKKGYTFVTPFMPKGSLEDLLANQSAKPMDLTQKLVIILSIAHTMAYLHRNCVLHGNLHPRNILIEENGMIKLCDYGLNWFLTKSPAQKDAENGRATPYTSTELVIGACYDFSIDVYSFGSIVYELLYGKKPYGHDNPYKTALFIGRGFLYTLDGCPEAKPFEGIIKMCWGTRNLRIMFEAIINQIWTILNQMKNHKVQMNKIYEALQYFNSQQVDVIPKTAPKIFMHMKFGTIGGDPRPMIDYAQTFMDGVAWPPNYEKALYYMKLAAEKGNENACQQLAQLLEEGRFVQQDYIEAYDLYETASRSKDCSFSQYKFATFLVNGIGGIKDPKRGFDECKKAADKKNADATNYLGELCAMGIGTKQDLHAAKTHFQEAVKLGSAKAMYNLASLMENSGKPKWSEIIPLYEQAAAKDQPDAMNRLGELLMTGTGVKRADPDRAFNLFMLASSQGHTRSKYNFALCLLRQNNSDVAMDYMREAAKEGCVEAQQYLAQH